MVSGSKKKTLTTNETKVVKELKELIYELRAVIIGSIRQELLSGLSDEVKFNNLKEKLKVFDDLSFWDRKIMRKQQNYPIIAEKRGFRDLILIS